MVTARTITPYAAMVVIQLAYGGSNILIKIALEKGLNQIVFIVYRHLVAVLVFGPMAYAFERNKRPPLSFANVLNIFLLASLGTTIHLNLYYVGLNYTSATVASALGSVIPALTFLLAVLLRMEKVMIRSVNSQMKVIGAVICIGGALTFTFWKGRYLFDGMTKTPLINIQYAKMSHQRDWIKGSALIITSNAAWSAWLILQAVICKIYPAQLSLNALICLFGSVQSCIVAVIFNRQPATWKLGWDLNLLTIIYCGTLNSGLVYYLQMWVISEKGPVFAAMFSPLLLVVVGIFSAIAFAEGLHIGSLVGAVFIIIGLYCVLWGKKKDDQVKEEPWSRESCVHL
ncbi:Wat1-related protein [Thalictrum thalictroides]|uniref:WAT1-related protein n=1 Tax=Thalictrum thalictroides TaxID=46969 RepID=A0A7J6UZU8_THATH|nr:Wat1-related protein [Thalictrum thalictroides]